jgi:hypothetical protein
MEIAMSERKQKVAKRRAEREANKVEPAFERDYSMESAPAQVQVVNPLPDKYERNYKIDNTQPAQVQVGNPFPEETPELDVRAMTPKISAVGNVNANNTTGLNNPTTTTPVEEKPTTIAELLKEARQQAKDEKTSAVKMQKYYALADALKALGDMGSTAIGGAIGGGAMDAPYNIAEYKPNRGYLDAIENAKKANDRLRALDDKGFQFALRDEDRSFQQQMAKENRDFQAKMAELNFQRQEALAAGNHERAKELLAEKDRLQTAHDEKIVNLRYKHEKDIKQITKEIVSLQYGYGGKGRKTEIWFDDGSRAAINKEDYEALKKHLVGKRVGGRLVNKDNVDQIIAANPQYVSSLLDTYDSDYYYPAKTETVGTTQPSETTVQPAGMSLGIGFDTYNQWRANQPYNLVGLNPEFNQEEFDEAFAGYKD